MIRSDKSAVKKLLLALIPYTDENITLTVHPHKFIHQLSSSLDTPSKSISNYLYRAKTKGYLEEIESDHHRKTFSFTPKGKILVISNISKRKKHWDGNWRCIFFDIPEKFRFKRNIFRTKLKELGFKKLQQSAWVSPFDYSKEIDILISELELENYVQIIIGKSIHGEDVLKKHFNLK